MFIFLKVLSERLCFGASFLSWTQFSNSDQQIVIFPKNGNRNRFAEPTSLRIGIGIVCEFHNLQIGIRIIFVRWEVLVNYSQIPNIYFLSKKCQKVLFLDSYIFFI